MLNLRNPNTFYASIKLQVIQRPDTQFPVSIPQSIKNTIQTLVLSQSHTSLICNKYSNLISMASNHKMSARMTIIRLNLLSARPAIEIAQRDVEKRSTKLSIPRLTKPFSKESLIQPQKKEMYSLKLQQPHSSNKNSAGKSWQKPKPTKPTHPPSQETHALPPTETQLVLTE